MIDIGVNLTNSQLRADLDSILTRAKHAGIEQLIITGTDLRSSIEATQICDQFQSEQYPTLSCTAGLHPHDASTWNKQVSDALSQLLTHPKVVAVGETGLDFNRNFSTASEQESAFRAQIELACQHQKPLFLHERDAFAKQIEILDSFAADLPSVVIHCFTGNAESLNGYLERGFYIGITGWVCDERRGVELAELISDIPLDRLMIETDAPYLLPRNIQPKPKSRVNEPANLGWVVKKLAECYGVEEVEVASRSARNAIEFFGLDF